MPQRFENFQQIHSAVDENMHNVEGGGNSFLKDQSGWQRLQMQDIHWEHFESQ